MSSRLTPQDILLKPELYTGGHGLCPGCGPSIVMKLLTKAFRGPTVVVCATGCVEVSTTTFPYSSWKVPFMHNAFENAASTASGVLAAFKALNKRTGEPVPDVVAIGGDGGTFDIGLQALSAVFERGEDILYVCYDNEVYANTGYQRSGATPKGANTTTVPVGKLQPGKPQWKKPIAMIMIAHRPKYVATASPHLALDLVQKAKRGIEVDGPAFLHVISPCVLAWDIPSSTTLQYAKLAVETRIFPLFEWEDGVFRVTYKPPKYVPVEEYFRGQARFKHLLAPENKPLLDEIQKEVDARWEELLFLEESTRAFAEKRKQKTNP